MKACKNSKFDRHKALNENPPERNHSNLEAVEPHRLTPILYRLRFSLFDTPSFECRRWWNVVQRVELRTSSTSQYFLKWTGQLKQQTDWDRKDVSQKDLRFVDVYFFTSCHMSCWHVSEGLGGPCFVLPNQKMQIKRLRSS